MKIYFLTTLSAFTVSIANGAQDLGKWSAKCSLGKTKVNFEAVSKSGDPYEDDMTAQIQIGKNKIFVPIGKGLFRPIELGKKLGICDKTVGVQIEKNLFILLFAIDNRPDLDVLAALLIDTASRNILDINKNLGSFLHSQEKQIQIEKTESGFRALMAQGWNKSAKTDGSKEISVGWIKVSVNNGNIFAEWEKSLPETHSTYANPHVAQPVTGK